ncbi:MAG: AAA family ATPase [Methanomicrobiales archaeon]|nr:AAA family ATPase [Methanomicrobiales archaeon]
MKLESIRLINYACFRDILVPFNSTFNIIAGINGSGKSSLLKATRDYLIFYSSGIVPELKNPRIEVQIHEGRYRFERQYPVSIEVQGKQNINDTSFQSSITKLNDIQIPSVEGEYKTLLYGQNVLNKDEIFPVFVYYDAVRSWIDTGKPINEVQIMQEKSSRMDAYIDWKDAARGTDALKDWVIVQTMERLQTFVETGCSPNNTENVNDELALVNQAISMTIKEAKGLRYDIKQRSLLMEWNRSDGEVFTALFDNLSDGERVMVALVADIARRACILNPHLGEKVLQQTPGVVLIDELDLHLHPKWERQLPNGLKKAFPAMQFIATTHSPQILSELSPDEIILISGETAENPEASYGLNSDRILEDIMDAASRPQKIKDSLSKLFLAIERNSLDEAREYLKELSKEAPAIMEIATARALMKRKEILGR